MVALFARSEADGGAVRGPFEVWFHESSTVHGVSQVHEVVTRAENREQSRERAQQRAQRAEHSDSTSASF